MRERLKMGPGFEEHGKKTLGTKPGLGEARDGAGAGAGGSLSEAELFSVEFPTVAVPFDLSASPWTAAMAMEHSQPPVGAVFTV